MVHLTSDGGVMGAFARAYALLGPTIAMRDGESWLEIARWDPDNHWLAQNGAPQLREPTFYRGLGHDLPVALVPKTRREVRLDVSSLQLRNRSQERSVAAFQGGPSGREIYLARLDLDSGLWVNTSGDFGSLVFASIVIGDPEAVVAGAANWEETVAIAPRGRPSALAQPLRSTF